MTQHELHAGATPAGSLDEGGRLLAATVLAAAGRGDRSAIAELTAPLDVDQLRSLVATLAVQVDQVMPAEAASGPAAVCELAINASAPLFGVTPEDIRSPQRSRPISDARAVAMTAARENGLSLPAIAEEFGKDHGSVIHAVRRTQQRPRLADAAARVTQHVSDRYTERLPRTQETAAPVPESTFEPHDLVDHAVVAAARAFDTTPETLIGADRTRATADARGVAMTAARMRGQSLPQIARHFDRDHTTVLHATRRIEKTPPLRDLAAKIAGELADEPSEAGKRARAASGQETVGAAPNEPSGPRSPGCGARASADARKHDRAPPAGGTVRPRHPIALAATLAVAAAASAGLAGTSLTALLDDPSSSDDHPAAASSVVTARVTDVVDGDTVRVQTRAGRDLGRVRLLGIDAPEIAHGSEPADCYGNTATELLARLTPPGATVTLTADPRQSDRDVYGRLLRYVDHQGEDLSTTMLTAGAARLYDSDPPLVRASEHQLAAQDAQDDARGLWDAC